MNGSDASPLSRDPGLHAAEESPSSGVASAVGVAAPRRGGSGTTSSKSDGTASAMKSLAVVIVNLESSNHAKSELREKRKILHEENEQKRLTLKEKEIENQTQLLEMQAKLNSEMMKTLYELS
jgi:hypothetical protein